MIERSCIDSLSTLQSNYRLQNSNAVWVHVACLVVHVAIILASQMGSRDFKLQCM